MSYETYKLLHIIGLVLLSLGIGGCLRTYENAPKPRLAMVMHGLGLVLMLVAGFGMLARLSISWPWPAWVFGKVVIWLALGAAPALIKRRVLPPAAAWLVVLALAAGAAWLAIQKPTF